MSNIDQISTFKALEQARLQRNAGLLDYVLREPGAGEQMGLKRVQFETHPGVVEHFEQVCELLNVSKREFLEAALVDALARAESRFHQVFRESTGHDFGEES